MSWFYLLLAGAFEIVFALSLKYSAGFTRLWPSLAVVAGASASLWLMTRAMRQIPVGTAYAVWTGIGALGVAVLGMALFGESASPARLGLLALILIGVIGLKLVEA